MRKALRLLPLLMCCLLLGGCSQEKKIRIGVAQCSNDDWRRKMNEEIHREAMFHDGVEVEIRSADDSNEKQIADLQYFRDNGFDIILVAPNEETPLTQPINDIYNAGIPIVVYDRNIDNKEYTAFQGADNYEIGENVAQYVANYGKDLNVIEIQGLLHSSPAKLRHEGFMHKADSLDLNVLASVSGKWNLDDARKVTDSLLRLYPETNVIYAHNDRMAIGAAEITRKLGRDDIRIVGIDAAPTIGMPAIADSIIDATFLYPTEGDELIRTAMAILRGEDYEKNRTLPSSVPVTLSNVQFFISQDQALRNETAKITVLQDKLGSFLKQYSMQKMALYGAFIILILFAVIIFLLTRYYWSSTKHRAFMEKTNDELKRQRDELDNLYQQLRESTGSRLSWFTNVSHDLRTPLTLIANPISQIAQADNLTPKQHTQMQLADKNVKRMQRLVNQILDIRKFDNSQLRLNLVNTNLTESVRSWTQSFGEIAIKRHINLKIDIPADDDIITAVDVEKTERIFFNLMSNAFKFSSENDTITISLRRDGDNAVLKVADTGRGIPVEDINHIFERFFRTETVNPNGSGIGLALSKVFIDMHGGTISVDSEVKKGSTFTVTLPIKEVSVPPGDGELSVPNTTAHVAPSTIDVSELEPVEDEEVNVQEDTPAVLVIDDNRDICTLMRSILSDKYTVITAHSGAQGIRLANKYVPDLIICDVMMPGTDGFDVCRSLKSDVLTSHIPILLLTACTLDEQRIQGYDCGADAYMSKPFESNVLLAQCNSLIFNRRILLQKGAETQMPDNRQQPAVIDDGSGRGRPSSQGIEDEFLQRFTAIVEQEIANAEITVEDLADRMGISRVQLYRKIKGLTNYSVAELIRNIRLKRAATLLKTTEMTVSEVAYSVGFSTPSYFTRCYKDYYGESPSDTHNRIHHAK